MAVFLLSSIFKCKAIHKVKLIGSPFTCLSFFNMPPSLEIVGGHVKLGESKLEKLILRNTVFPGFSDGSHLQHLELHHVSGACHLQSLCRGARLVVCQEEDDPPLTIGDLSFKQCDMKFQETLSGKPWKKRKTCDQSEVCVSVTEGDSE